MLKIYVPWIFQGPGVAAAGVVVGEAVIELRRAVLELWN